MTSTPNNAIKLFNKFPKINVWVYKFYNEILDHSLFREIKPQAFDIRRTYSYW